MLREGCCLYEIYESLPAGGPGVSHGRWADFSMQGCISGRTESQAQRCWREAHVQSLLRVAGLLVGTGHDVARVIFLGDWRPDANGYGCMPSLACSCMHSIHGMSDASGESNRAGASEFWWMRLAKDSMACQMHGMSGMIRGFCGRQKQRSSVDETGKKWLWVGWAG